MNILTGIINIILWLIAGICVVCIVFYNNVMDFLGNFYVSFSWLTKTALISCTAACMGVSGILLLFRGNKAVKIVGAAIVMAVVEAIIALIVVKFV